MCGSVWWRRVFKGPDEGSGSADKCPQQVHGSRADAQSSGRSQHWPPLHQPTRVRQVPAPPALLQRAAVAGNKGAGGGVAARGQGEGAWRQASGKGMGGCIVNRSAGCRVCGYGLPKGKQKDSVAAVQAQAAAGVRGRGHSVQSAAKARCHSLGVVAREVNPLGVAKLVAHEVEVRLACRGRYRVAVDAEQLAACWRRQRYVAATDPHSSTRGGPRTAAKAPGPSPMRPSLHILLWPFCPMHQPAAGARTSQ